MMMDRGFWDRRILTHLEELRDLTDQDRIRVLEAWEADVTAELERLRARVADEEDA